MPSAMSISQRLRKALKEHDWSENELARQSGVPQPTIHRILTEESKSPRMSTLEKLAGALGLTGSELAYGREDKSSDTPGDSQHPNISAAPNPQGMCPEISWVQAGQWAEVCHVEHDPEAVNWYPRPPGASDQTFVLRVVGESMAPEYSPGTLIYVDPERAAETGKDVIAVMTETGEATFKRFIEEPGTGKMLKALNPAWTNPYLPINGNCRVVGVVVADMRMR